MSLRINVLQLCSTYILFQPCFFLNSFLRSTALFFSLNNAFSDLWVPWTVCKGHQRVPARTVLYIDSRQKYVRCMFPLCHFSKNSALCIFRFVWHPVEDIPIFCHDICCKWHKTNARLWDPALHWLIPVANCALITLYISQWISNWWVFGVMVGFFTSCSLEQRVLHNFYGWAWAMKTAKVYFDLEKFLFSDLKNSSECNV